MFALTLKQLISKEREYGEARETSRASQSMNRVELVVHLLLTTTTTTAMIDWKQIIPVQKEKGREKFSSKTGFPEKKKIMNLFPATLAWFQWFSLLPASRRAQLRPVNNFLGKQANCWANCEPKLKSSVQTERERTSEPCWAGTIRMINYEDSIFDFLKTFPLVPVEPPCTVNHRISHPFQFCKTGRPVNGFRFPCKQSEKAKS